MRRGAEIIPLTSNARDFVVLAAPHSDSASLMEYLAMSPEIEAHSFPENSDQHNRVRLLEGFRHLDELRARRRATSIKLMYSQLRRHPEVLAWLALRRVPVVHMFRSNPFDVVISSALAQKREVPGRLSLWLDPAVVLQQIDRLKREQRRMRMLLRCLPVRSIDVSHEALCREAEACDRLLEFIGINRLLMPVDVCLTIHRLERHRQEILENYSEVRTVLVAAGHEELLHEPRLISGAA